MFRKRTIERTDSSAAALVREGRTALAANDFEEAMRIAKQLYRMKNTGAYEIHARTCYARGQINKAISILRQAIKRHPSVPFLSSYLGEYYSNAGRYDEAILAFEGSASGCGPARGFADLNIAIVKYRAGDYMGSLLRVNLIMPDDEGPPRWLVESTRAWALYGLGRIEEALAALKTPFDAPLPLVKIPDLWSASKT